MATLMRLAGETDAEWERRKGLWYRKVLEIIMASSKESMLRRALAAEIADPMTAENIVTIKKDHPELHVYGASFTWNR